VLLRGGARPGVRSTSLDMTPYELASFCGLDAAAELLRGFAAETAHPTGMTELWLAAASRLPEAEQASVVRELAKLSDVNAVWRTATPLMMAAGHAGHFRVADELLAAGADVDAGTSLLHACCDWHFECLGPGLDYLVRAGWNVNSHDAQGQTALHKAAFLGYTATLRTLLEQGANPDARDADGLTARDLALQWKKGPAIKVLA